LAGRKGSFLLAPNCQTASTRNSAKEERNGRRQREGEGGREAAIAADEGGGGEGDARLAGEEALSPAEKAGETRIHFCRGEKIYGTDSLIWQGSKRRRGAEQRSPRVFLSRRKRIRRKKGGKKKAKGEDFHGQPFICPLAIIRQPPGCEPRFPQAKCR